MSELVGSCLEEVCPFEVLAGPVTGLVTNSILFCCLFTIRDQCKKVRFQQTHNQGLRQLLLTLSWDLRA